MHVRANFWQLCRKLSNVYDHLAGNYLADVRSKNNNKELNNANNKRFTIEKGKYNKLTKHKHTAQ